MMLKFPGIVNRAMSLKTLVLIVFITCSETESLMPVSGENAVNKDSSLALNKININTRFNFVPWWGGGRGIG